MKAVILAGGLGTRISEETDRIPKPMVTIGGQPILWHIMKTFGHHGVTDFIVCLGYKSHIIKEYFAQYLLNASDVTIDLRTGKTTLHHTPTEPWTVTLVETGVETQTGGRLRRVREYLDNEAFCLTYGDGLSDVDITALVQFHRHHGRIATVTAITPPGRFGVLQLEGEHVERFAEKIDMQHHSINGGYFVLNPAAIDYIEGDSTVWEHGPMERLARDGQLMAYRHNGFWQAMDTLRERRQLEDMWQSGRPPWRVWT